MSRKNKILEPCRFLCSDWKNERSNLEQPIDFARLHFVKWRYLSSLYLQVFIESTWNVFLYALEYTLASFFSLFSLQHRNIKKMILCIRQDTPETKVKESWSI